MVLKWAVMFFSMLPVERHGVCEVYKVAQERDGLWVACAACKWKDMHYLGAMLLECDGKVCNRWDVWPKGVNPGVCEAPDA